MLTHGPRFCYVGPRLAGPVAPRLYHPYCAPFLGLKGPRGHSGPVGNGIGTCIFLAGPSLLEGPGPYLAKLPQQRRREHSRPPQSSPAKATASSEQGPEQCLLANLDCKPKEGRAPENPRAGLRLGMGWQGCCGGLGCRKEVGPLMLVCVSRRTWGQPQPSNRLPVDQKAQPTTHRVSERFELRWAKTFPGGSWRLVHAVCR